MKQRKASSGVQTMGSPRHVEAGVDQDRTAGQPLEGGDQRVVARVRLPVHGLDARRVVDMGDRRDVGARHIQLVDTEERLFGFAHLPPMGVLDLGDQQHVGAVAVDLKPVRDILAQHRGREGPEGLPVLDLEVEGLLHGRRAGIAENRAGAQRPRPELHAGPGTSRPPDRPPGPPRSARSAQPRPPP